MVKVACNRFIQNGLQPCTFKINYLAGLSVLQNNKARLDGSRALCTLYSYFSWFGEILSHSRAEHRAQSTESRAHREQGSEHRAQGSEHRAQEAGTSQTGPAFGMNEGPLA